MGIVRISEPYYKVYEKGTRPGRKRAFAMYRCDCGKEFERRCDSARTTESCGCYQIQKLLTYVVGNANRRTHDMSKTRIYKSWHQMISRCKNPNDQAYDRYGGRGINVCDRWQKFENFYEDMGDRPADTSLDRIDNNGNYCKENCRWATSSQQANNRRSCVYITIDGVKKTASQWSKEHGARGRKTIIRRINAGFQAREAVFKR